MGTINLEKQRDEVEMLLAITPSDQQKFKSIYSNVSNLIKMSMAERNKGAELELKSGDIWMVDLGFNCGSEMDKRRPVVIISGSDDYNKRSNCVTVVPISSSLDPKKMFDSQMVIDESNFVQKEDAFKNDNPIYGVAKVEQMRTTSKGRFFYKQGSLTDEGITELRNTITSFIF